LLAVFLTWDGRGILVRVNALRLKQKEFQEPPQKLRYKCTPNRLKDFERNRKSRDSSDVSLAATRPFRLPETCSSKLSAPYKKLPP
jgi:hypothetical protein